MPRTAITTLVGIAAIGLSCERPQIGAAGLPLVSAPPPVVEQEVAISEPPPAEVGNPAAYTDEELTSRIASHVQARQRDTMTATEIDAVARAVVEGTQRYGIEPGLILAVIHVESRFDNFAVSSAGALGLMQILPSTGAELAAREGIPWFGPRSLFDPVVNVRLGTAYLDQLSERYRDTRTALAAYNWGPGHIDRRLRLGTPIPTVYPGMVLEAWFRQRNQRS